MNIKHFHHNTTLQLFDGNSFPVENTQFTINILVITEKISKKIRRVTLKFPTINFQTGQLSAKNNDPTPITSGIIGTNSGYLCSKIRPGDAIFQSFLVPNNNGLSLPFSYKDTTFPNPIPGFILSIGIDGSITIFGNGQFNNLIPAGAYTLPPTTIVYIAEITEILTINTKISLGPSNITQFPSFAESSNVGYRDTHFNDSFDNIVAWTWSDNFGQNLKNGILNCMVAVGEVCGKEIKIKYINNLSNITTATNLVFDTAVAVNRKDKDNLVVSWAYINNVTTPITGYTYRAISFDRGKTWPVEWNGQINLNTGIVPGDVPGVKSDKDGNIWYVVTGTPGILIWISKDKGKTFSNIYTIPAAPSGMFYDFPEYTFGGDGLGNYGIWLAVDQIVFIGEIFDSYPFINFIPLSGTPTDYVVNQPNTQEFPNVTASMDGRVWISSYSPNISNLYASTIRYKSPGPIYSNYAGPWQVTISNQLSDFYGVPDFISFPGGYFNSAQTIIYDEQRKVLYAMFANQIPIINANQNMGIYLLISGNNGQTWTKPLYISTIRTANRGFPSMTLDTVTKNLIFGWYDGRNDPTFQSVEYYGAVIPAETLDHLIADIVLSNPIYLSTSVVTTGKKISTKITRKRLFQNKP